MNTTVRRAVWGSMPGLKTTTIAVLLLLVSSCTLFYPSATPPHCDFGEVRFSSDFSAGRIDGCKQSGTNSYVLSLRPENSPINHSPWYSFTVVADSARSISVTLQYLEHKHRYHPKLSADGERWQPMLERNIEVLSDGMKARLTLDVGPSRQWVSAQEIIDNADYTTWLEELNARPYLHRSLLGKSAEGRDIYKLESIDSQQSRSVIFVGRQHPPEVTGALAMIAFMERVFASDELATAFRRHYRILMVPNLNPDGVYHGNWRHNAGGVDLNRDWGPFTQPETQLMRDELARFTVADSARPYLFLDFHSTAKDVFYTQPAEMPTLLPGFTGQWMQALESSVQTVYPSYQVRSVPGHNPDKPTAKAYMHDTFGIPAITLELGDETDREFIEIYAQKAAEEMMTLLLSLATESP